MKIDDITEGADSAALHTANAKHAACINKLEELLKYHQDEADAEGVAVNGIELAEDLASFIEDERMNKDRLLSSVESNELTETSGEQYEVMLDRAGELGEHIASNVLLDDHTESWGIGADRSGPEEITTIVNKHLTVAIKRMKDVAYKYIQRRLRKD